MDYVPTTAVWEITMGCNMRCGHCGSSCAEPLPDELTTEEALRVCDEMQAVGLKWITLSGGEPLTRKDWPVLAARLHRNGIIPNIITNGWLVDDKMVETADKCGVATVSISLDGDRETHDALRKPGSYDHVMQAFQALRRRGHTSAANTTVTKRNLHQLDRLKAALVENGVDLWQIQIGLPMGNLSNHRDAVVDVETIDTLIDFAYRTTLEGRIKVFPADCLGYYTQTEGIVRQLSIGTPSYVTWQGCNAGKRSFGLLHNGDVLGCTSIRDRAFIEGNIRQRPLVEIWNDPERFAWSRGMKKTSLTGQCKSCGYGDVCLGGCPNTRLTISGSIYAENRHCSFNVSLGRVRERLNSYEDPAQLLDVARVYVRSQKWQLAGLALERALQLQPDDIDLLELYGFVSFSLGNFETAKHANEQILKNDTNNTYGLKGLGLSLHRLNQSERGIEHLLRAVELSTPEDMDAYFDLSIVYRELGRHNEAQAILARGEQRAPGFSSRRLWTANPGMVPRQEVPA